MSTTINCPTWCTADHTRDRESDALGPLHTHELEHSIAGLELSLLDQSDGAHRDHGVTLDVAEPFRACVLTSAEARELAAVLMAAAERLEQS